MRPSCWFSPERLVIKMSLLRFCLTLPFRCSCGRVRFVMLEQQERKNSPWKAYCVLVVAPITV
jgi:hypothetical protein